MFGSLDIYYIKNKAYKIIVDAFKKFSLGSIVDVSDITSTILNINGVSDIKTV